jgi:integrase/recombinase XerD
VNIPDPIAALNVRAAGGSDPHSFAKGACIMSRPVSQPIPGDPQDPEGLSVLLHRYLVWLETHHFALNTARIRRRQLSRFILWCDERSITQAREVAPPVIERFQRHLFYYRQRNGQPLSISSQSHWLTALRGWFTWLKEQHLIPHNPTVEMRLPQQEKRLPRHALSVEEVEAVLAQANITQPVGLRTRALLETLYSTGMRRMEALNLSLSDIDRSRGVVLIRQGKGRKDRYAPIGQRALAWIDKYLREARPLLVRDESQQLLFVTQEGGPVHPNNLSALVRRYLRQAGIHKQGACHLFRHAAASLMLEAGADIRHLQEILGHQTLQTTQIYTHVSIGKLCEVHARTHPGRLFRSRSSRRGVSDRQRSPLRRRCRHLLILLRKQLRRLSRRLRRFERRRPPQATTA